MTGGRCWWRRVLPLALWCYLVWVLLTWTLTLEQLVAGAAVALAVALCLAPIGPVVPPWRVLHPRRLAALCWLVASSAGRVLVANVKLAYRIWAPRRPLNSGMVLTPTEMASEGGLGSVGLITSLIVDNQIVDVDRARHMLLYHAVTVPDPAPEAARAAINGPVEALIRRVEEAR